MDSSAPKVSIETFLSVIIQCSVLAVGLHRQDFRTKDVMFYLDLIKDLVINNKQGKTVSIQFIQIQRWLKRYEELGWVRIQRKGNTTIFRIKNAGWEGLLRSLAGEDHLMQIPEALLIQQFLDAYLPFLKNKILAETSQNLAIEQSIQKYLKSGLIFKNQIRLLDQMIASQERRSQESLRLQNHCNSELQRGTSPKDIAAHMPSEFSYKLSNQKTFSDLLRELPEALVEFDIRKGFELRHKRFYEPYRDFLKMQRNFYENLLADATPSKDR